jgi:hypothetical protein
MGGHNKMASTRFRGKRQRRLLSAFADPCQVMQNVRALDELERSNANSWRQSFDENPRFAAKLNNER